MVTETSVPASTRVMLAPARALKVWLPGVLLSCSVSMLCKVMTWAPMVRVMLTASFRVMSESALSWRMSVPAPPVMAVVPEPGMKVTAPVSPVRVFWPV